VEYLSRAGYRAAEQGAHSEAIGNFTRGVELLQRLPECADRDRQELDLQMALSWSWFVVQGPLASERESALIRARELCEQLGENAKLMETLLALGHARANRTDFAQARELGEKVLTMAQEANAQSMLASAHAVLGIVSFSAGLFLAAREHLECAVE